MTKTHIKRLEKLATHLERGKLFHNEFDFNVVHKLNNCGTAGCAMGEMPLLWPKQFTMRDVCLSITLPFFGITHDESYHLFVPECQEPENYGGRMLYDTATRKQVASNIRAFIKLKRQLKG